MTHVFETRCTCKELCLNNSTSSFKPLNTMPHVFETRCTCREL